MSGVCPWWSYLFLLSHFTLDNGCDVRQSSAILVLKLVSAGLLAADHQWRISADGCNLVVSIKLNFHNTLSIQLWRTFIWSICPLERVAHSRLKPKTLVVKNNENKFSHSYILYNVKQHFHLLNIITPLSLFTFLPFLLPTRSCSKICLLQTIEGFCSASEGCNW